MGGVRTHGMELIGRQKLSRLRHGRHDGKQKPGRIEARAFEGFPTTGILVETLNFRIFFNGAHFLPSRQYSSPAIIQRSLRTLSILHWTMSLKGVSDMTTTSVLIAFLNGLCACLHETRRFVETFRVDHFLKNNIFLGRVFFGFYSKINQKLHFRGSIFDNFVFPGPIDSPNPLRTFGKRSKKIFNAIDPQKNRAPDRWIQNPTR